MEFVVFSNRHYVEIGKTQHAIKREKSGSGPLDRCIFSGADMGWGGGRSWNLVLCIPWLHKPRVSMRTLLSWEKNGCMIVLEFCE